MADLFALEDAASGRATAASSTAKPLSPAKQRFLASGQVGEGRPATREATQLTFGEFKALAESYKARHGVSIHIAGEVEPQLLRNWHGLLGDTFRAQASEILDAPDAGMLALKAFWGEFRNDKALGKLAGASDPSDPKLKARLSRLLETNHMGLRDRVMTRAVSERDSIPQRVDKFGLNDKDGAKELLSLAANPMGSAHGYLFPTKLTDRYGKSHAETYIVSSSGKLIKPIPYPPQGAPEVPGQYASEVSALMLSGRKLSPQADKVSCGSLGMSYLKQYLKDDARQLNQESLLVDCQVGGKTVNFHLPAAAALKYSQSDAYNKVMRAIVAGEGPTARVTHKGEEFEVMTLKGIIEAGGSIGRPDGAPLAGGLEAFRAAWLSKLDAAEAQRSQMTVGGRNQYLAYTTNRHDSKVNTSRAA